ncbi:MarR family transcriptional regulator [Lentzea sp. NBRC 105346]|uniref:MarR family winged helix-turn-helix transcriptional regulator n=1 Tax=Lentzea sp. NBRC 105346 TaxID=3032205 RepID=UPI00255281EF|nr:MarR family transcriptional regulator [Lentzea sp. NBRC 105346]
MSTPKCTDLMMLLHQASYALETELTAKLAEIGLTPRGRCVLSSAVDAGRTQTELADLSNMDKTTMVVTMDALEKAGLAERRLSPTDRRARVIEVTQAGREMLAKADQVVAQVYDEVLGELPEDERDGLLKALTRLVDGRFAELTPCEKPPRRRALRHAVG